MMLADARQIDPNGKDLEAAHVGVEGVSCAERFFDQLQPYVVVASQSGGGVPGMEAIGDHLRGDFGAAQHGPAVPELGVNHDQLRLHRAPHGLQAHGLATLVRDARQVVAQALFHNELPRATDVAELAKLLHEQRHAASLERSLSQWALDA